MNHVFMDGDTALKWVGVIDKDEPVVDVLLICQLLTVAVRAQVLALVAAVLVGARPLTA